MPLYQVTLLTNDSEAITYTLFAKNNAEAIGKAVLTRGEATEDPAYVGITAINAIEKYESNEILYHEGNTLLDHLEINIDIE